jgi:hypothetical protein
MPLRDHFLGFELSDSMLERHRNATRLIGTLQIGLESLAQQVRRAEAEVAAAISAKFAPTLKDVGAEASSTDATVFMTFNLPGLEGPRQSFIECCFHWYSVSACNLVELIGGIRLAHESDALPLKKYVHAVVPEVLAWRDKIGAHPVQFREDRRDNDAERNISTMPPLTFEKGRLVVQAFSLQMRRGGEPSNSAALQPWSLTEVHEQLRARYLPRPAPNAG